ncbi:MAG: hypothetical protein IJA60_02735 [Clostridia bacterium]|nr:hypothetical protein [Clostridia bacterium]
MGKFDKGITWYTTAIAHIPVHFPEDDVKCKWCPHLRADEANSRHFCRLTGNVVYSIEIIADDCPLEFEENKDEHI